MTACSNPRPRCAEADFQTGGCGFQLDELLKQTKQPPPEKTHFFFKLKKLYEEYSEAFIKQANKPKTILFLFLFQGTGLTCPLPTD